MSTGGIFDLNLSASGVERNGRRRCWRHATARREISHEYYGSVRRRGVACRNQRHAVSMTALYEYRGVEGRHGQYAIENKPEKQARAANMRHRLWACEVAGSSARSLLFWQQ